MQPHKHAWTHADFSQVDTHLTYKYTCRDTSTYACREAIQTNQMKQSNYKPGCQSPAVDLLKESQLWT